MMNIKTLFHIYLIYRELIYMEWIKNIDDLPNNVTVANNQKINIINKSSVNGGMLLWWIRIEVLVIRKY